ECVNPARRRVPSRSTRTLTGRTWPPRWSGSGAVQRRASLGGAGADPRARHLTRSDVGLPGGHPAALAVTPDGAPGEQHHVTGTTKCRRLVVGWLPNLS